MKQVYEGANGPASKLDQRGSNIFAQIINIYLKLIIKTLLKSMH